MDGSQAIPDGTATDTGLDFDAIVIGAGVSGLYQLYRLRELGLKVRVFETGSAVGGTWYWNRYPGARFDSESWTYGYSFSRELLEEWDWEEHFAGQPETERYLNYVADKFDLRRDIQFNSRVTAVHYQEGARSWDVILEDGRHYNTRFLITAVGVLSAPTMPRIPGVESFRGQSCHTHYWPKEPVKFEGKRVAVIGTGATAVQTITEVAKTAGHLTVFQRTPQWCAPLHNAKIAQEEMRRIRANYAEIFARCQETYGCFIHSTDPRSALEVTPEEREAFWEKLYGEPGFGINETPIARITPTGIKTSDAEYEFDIIIYATGFDAIAKRSGRRGNAQETSQGRICSCGIGLSRSYGRRARCPGWAGSSRRRSRGGRRRRHPDCDRHDSF